MSRRQTARVEFHRQPLEFPRASRQCRAHARDERLERVANLRRGVFDCALRRLHLPRPIPVPVAGLFALAAFVALAAESVADLALQRFFDNQPQRQADQIAPSGRRPQVSVLPAPTESPLSCCDSGRVHPNPIFQQAYAFTGPTSRRVPIAVACSAVFQRDRE
jgi:hypothetical protein